MKKDQPTHQAKHQAPRSKIGRHSSNSGSSMRELMSSSNSLQQRRSAEENKQQQQQQQQEQLKVAMWLDWGQTQPAAVSYTGSQMMQQR
jgi:hypothetical protein